jgi:hypothetical protein
VVESVSVIDERQDRTKLPRRHLGLFRAGPNSFIALGLIIAATLWRTWAVMQWTFQNISWRELSAVRAMSLWAYIPQTQLGHLAPAQHVIFWVTTKVAPLDYFVSFLPLLLMSFLSGWLMWRFLQVLFGDRPGNLIPLAVFLLCPLTAPSLISITFALGTIPVQLFVVLTLFALLLYVRAPSNRRLALVALAYVGGLLFSEKSLLILPTAVMFLALFLGEGQGRARLVDVTLRRWRLWTVLGGITLLYVLLYLGTAGSQQSHTPSSPDIAGIAKAAILTSVIPTLLGGPWSSISNVIPDLSGAARILVLALFAAIVLASFLWRRQSWRGWTLAVVYVASCIGVVVTSNRFDVLGVLIGKAGRYFSDCVPALALGLALAFMVPLERGADPAWGRRPFAERLLARLRPGWWMSPPADGRSLPLRSNASRGPSPWPTRTLALGVVAAYAASALITGTKTATKGDELSARAWLANVKTGLAGSPTAAIYDSLLPERAVSKSAWIVGFAPRASITLGPFAPRVRWNAPSDELLTFDQAGRLRPANVVPGEVVEPGPFPGCGFRAGRGVPFVARLPAPLFHWDWGVSLRYSSDTDDPGLVTVDGDRQPVTFHRGSHTMILAHAGTARSVTVESRQGPVCVSDIVVGLVQPSAAG